MTSFTRPKIGIRLPSQTGLAQEIIAGVTHYLHEHGAWQLEIENDGQGDQPPNLISSDWQGDGVILFRATEAELDHFDQQGIAVVLLSTEGPDHDFPRVLPDNEEAGAMAASHLLGTGIQSFAFISRRESLRHDDELAPSFRYYARERLKGFKQELGRHGYQPAIHYLPPYSPSDPNSWSQIEDSVTKLIESLPTPTGLFAVDDALATQIVATAERISRDVPDDLCVIGFGDDPFYRHSAPQTLTSVAYPARTIGYKAAQVLADQLNKPPVAADVARIPPTPLVPRESTDLVAIDDEETVRLLRWIREQAPYKAILVADLETQSSYSLSTIKDRFRIHLGHSPKDEIKRVRVQHLSDLLQDSEKSMSEISDSMGFASPHEMGRFFQREMKESPTSYRERVQKR